MKCKWYFQLQPINRNVSSNHNQHAMQRINWKRCQTLHVMVIRVAFPVIDTADVKADSSWLRHLLMMCTTLSGGETHVLPFVCVCVLLCFCLLCLFLLGVCFWQVMCEDWTFVFYFLDCIWQVYGINFFIVSFYFVELVNNWKEQKWCLF